MSDERNIANDLCAEAHGILWTPELHRVHERASVPSVSGGYRSEGIEQFPVARALADRFRERVEILMKAGR
jgi:hypothetical protein